MNYLEMIIVNNVIMSAKLVYLLLTIVRYVQIQIDLTLIHLNVLVMKVGMIKEVLILYVDNVM